MTRTLLICFTILFTLHLSSAATNVTCDEVPGFNKNFMNFQKWDNVLKKFVTEGVIDGITINTVDYAGVDAENDFFEFGCQLKNSNLTGVSYNQWYAFYINAYNYLAIKTIINHACVEDIFGNCTSVKSIQDIGYPYPSIILNATVWDLKMGVIIAGQNVSLNEIEHERLRDPRAGGFHTENPLLHACIVCASVSCPNLKKGAYTVENLIAEMEANTVEFLANKKKGLVLDGSRLTISPIFNWFFDDFNDGKRPGINSTSKNLADFLAKYAPQDVRQFITDNAATINAGNTAIFVYNWNLNGEIGTLCASNGVCLSPLSLGIALGIIGFLVLVVIIIICCCGKSKRAGYQRTG